MLTPHLTAQQVIDSTNRIADAANAVAGRAMAADNFDVAQLATMLGLTATLLDGMARDLYGKPQTGSDGGDAGSTNSGQESGSASRR